MTFEFIFIIGLLVILLVAVSIYAVATTRLLHKSFETSARYHDMLNREDEDEDDGEDEDEMPPSQTKEYGVVYGSFGGGSGGVRC